MHFIKRRSNTQYMPSDRNHTIFLPEDNVLNEDIYPSKGNNPIVEGTSVEV